MTWQMLDELPNGWRFDKTAGSPVHGYVFATNGKSVINGQKRALIKVARECETHFSHAAPAALQPTTVEPAVHVEPAPPILVNELARKQFELRMLADIRFDLSVCEIEGWSKKEYINELCEMLKQLGKEI